MSKSDAPPAYAPHSGTVEPGPQPVGPGPQYQPGLPGQPGPQYQGYPGPQYQQPVMQQPMHTQQSSTTVVIAGNMGQANARPMRGWSTGICGCFEDPLMCLCVMCFQECYGCHLASKAGETCCLPCCVPAWMVSLRAHTRGKHNIQGTICDDCCMVYCCYPCAMCQLSRELDNINHGKAQA